MTALASVTRRLVSPDAVAWWLCGTDRWLRVRVAQGRGGATDGTTAVEFVGAASWAHGEYVYLAGTDADAWLASVGLAEGDVSSLHRDRRPDGYRTVRDAARADAVDGDPAWFAARDTLAHVDAATWSDGTPVPTVPPPDDDTARLRRARRADRKAAHRELAARLRALGYVPSGDVWRAAKLAVASGWPVTHETLTTVREVMA